jgi:hypothetical protein
MPLAQSFRPWRGIGKLPLPGRLLDVLRLDSRIVIQKSRSTKCGQKNPYK